jgi:hypothetical protein
MSPTWKSVTLLIVLFSSASLASAQSVGRVSSTPLNFNGSSESMSRISRPAPADLIESDLIDKGVVRASYYQAGSGRPSGPAPVNTPRVASTRGVSSSSGAVPIGSLPPATSVPVYYPTSFKTQSYTAPQGNGYYPIYGSTAGNYSRGAANYNPTLIPTAAYQQNCGPTGAPTYPIGGAQVPYAAPQQAPGARPFVPIARMPDQVYISRGLIGQPVVYVPGQPLRNGLRYILP